VVVSVHAAFGACSGAHPSQKPVALLERIVKLWTRPDDLILDCFLGTGTTAVAAKMHRRRWVRDRAGSGVRADRCAANIGNPIE